MVLIGFIAIWGTFDPVSVVFTIKGIFNFNHNDGTTELFECRRRMSLLERIS